MQTDDVACKGFFQLFTLGREERQGVSNLDVLADPHMAQFHAFFILAGADPHKGNPVTVLGIHVCLDLEYETAEFLFDRLYVTLVGRAGERLWRPVHDRVQDMIDTEVAQGCTKEDRCHLAL